MNPSQNNLLSTISNYRYPDTSTHTQRAGPDTAHSTQRPRASMACVKLVSQASLLGAEKCDLDLDNDWDK